MPKADLVQVMRKEALGPCYRMLKPEVKETLDKIVYQLDLCRNTIGLLESRITSNEDKLHSVMDYFKTEDLNFVSKLVDDDRDVFLETHDCESHSYG